MAARSSRSDAMANADNMFHFKLVLLGDTAVGKSCLVVRFVRDEFFEYQEPTIGGVCRGAAPGVARACVRAWRAVLHAVGGQLRS